MHVPLTNFPIAIPLCDKVAETVIQAFLQYIFVTFHGSFILITDNSEEFKKVLFQNLSNAKSKFSIPHHPHSNRILEKFYFFLRAGKTHTQQNRLGRYHSTFTLNFRMPQVSTLSLFKSIFPSIH